MNTHNQYIEQTLLLAVKAIGKTKTNPMVGAVLVLKKAGTEIIIGRGFHRGYGKPHAEVDAVRNAHSRGYHDFSDTVLYVNLEPCCHYGKTPPCTDFIIKEKIPHVVFGTPDPFPEVAGKSVRILRKAGIRVEYGFLEKECHELNKFFFKVVRTGLPWVTLKVAQTLDGKIADYREKSRWISSEESRKTVHRWRSEYDAVLVGAGTVLKDNPKLSVRMVKGRQPLRVIIDGKLSVPVSSDIFRSQDKQPTIVFTAANSNHPKSLRLKKKGITVISMPAKNDKIDLKKALKKLVARYQVSSVMVEGGSEIFNQMIGNRLADDVCAFIAPKLIGEGLSWTAGLGRRPVQKSVRLNNVSVRTTGLDTLISGRIDY